MALYPFCRTELLVGEEGIEKLKNSKVIVFGAAIKERIKLINPECKVEAKQVFVTAENIPDLITDDIDYVVDAIDTVTSKLALAEYFYKNEIKIMSSMGTGNKLDPTMFQVSDVYKTKVCPLAKVMRRELKKDMLKN